MRSISNRRRRLDAGPEAKAYKVILSETDRPWCWACGRDREQVPHNWFAEFRLERAHIASGQSRMTRILDRRAVVLACSLCHFLHSASGVGLNIVCGVPSPQISNASMLWLKREMDFDYFDLDWLAAHWMGRVPDPVEPHAWYLDQYAKRRPNDKPIAKTALAT